MGVASSLLKEQNYDLLQIMHTIHENNVRSLKRKIKYAKYQDILQLLKESIRLEKKLCFEFVLEHLGFLTKNLQEYIEEGLYIVYFSSCVKCSDPYYAMRFLEVYDEVPRQHKNCLLFIALEAENEFISHQIILKGANLAAVDNLGQTLLYVALKHDNFNLVSMLLYYGTYYNYPEKLSSFTYSIACHCSEEIQFLLMEYEADYNLTYNGSSVLFYAIVHKSPVILELLQRGADVNTFNGNHNVISLALLYNCRADIFKILWEKFDYNVWKNTFSKSVLLNFLDNESISPNYWPEYVKIFMENESKLKLDIESHNNSYFFESDAIISYFYLRCLNKQIDHNIIEGYVFQLLSYGAGIFKGDLDVIFRIPGTSVSFVQDLLYQTLLASDGDNCSIMYFKYTLEPDLAVFLMNRIFPSDYYLHSLRYITKLFVLNSELKNEILRIAKTEDICYEDCKMLLDLVDDIPSLLQLARDVVRKEICRKYLINNVCKFYTITKSLKLPRHIEDILLFEKAVYHISS